MGRGDWAEGKGEAGSLLGREPHAGLDLRTPGSGPEPTEPTTQAPPLF